MPDITVISLNQFKEAVLLADLYLKVYGEKLSALSFMEHGNGDQEHHILNQES